MFRDSYVDKGERGEIDGSLSDWLAGVNTTLPVTYDGDAIRTLVQRCGAPDLAHLRRSVFPSISFPHSLFSAVFFSARFSPHSCLHILCAGLT